MANKHKKVWKVVSRKPFSRKQTHLKIVHFIYCHKTVNATNIVDLFFEEILELHEVPISIVYYHDFKFLSYFLKVLFSKLGVKLLFSTM
jgi:hypothetical protein